MNTYKLKLFVSDIYNIHEKTNFFKSLKNSMSMYKQIDRQLNNTLLDIELTKEQVIELLEAFRELEKDINVSEEVLQTGRNITLQVNDLLERIDAEC